MLRMGMFLGNRYEIIGKIGSGGMSDVYKAKCHKLNRFVAIKVLKQEFHSDQNFVSKFRMEAQSAACLSHPSIVNIYDVGEENGIYYIVMELIEGITLKKYIERKKKLEIRESIEVAMQVARGLEAAHGEHIIHRDIKPQNIMISKEGKVKVTDFGIARAASTQTISSNTMGSVHYISPEQARGGYCDERSDIYSLGITMYEMLTGRVAFGGGCGVAVGLLLIQGGVVAPWEDEPMIPISLEKIILKCTQKKPEMRYASATELIIDLKKCLAMPNEDFVRIVPLDTDSPTMIFSEKEVEQVKRERDRRLERDLQEEKKYQMGIEEEEEKEEDEQENEEEDDDSRFERIITYVGIGVAVLIILIVGAIALHACGVFGGGSVVEDESGQVEMVSLLGMTYEEAQEALEELGLTLTATYGTSDDYEEGQIFKQDVEEGEMVDLTTSISVVISTGENLLTIPTDLEGKTVQVATNTLKVLGFSNIAETTVEENSDTVDAGYVIRTEPEMGSAMKADTQITLVISSGPAEVLVTVPSVVNSLQSTAQQTLEDLNLNVEIVQEASESVQEGYVIRQSPTSGTSLSEGSTVTITVSSGSSSATVSSVTGWSQSDAVTELTNAGFLVTIEEENSSDVASGYVIRQSPAGGSTLAKGSSVTIVVSQGASKVTVPGVLGLSESSAINQLRNAGFEVSVEYEECDESEDGLVISQSPSGSSSALPGSTVEIIVGKNTASE